MLALIMKDSITPEIVDEDFSDALYSLNNAGKAGLSFIRMDGTDGHQLLVNLSNILVMKELDDD